MRNCIGIIKVLLILVCVFIFATSVVKPQDNYVWGVRNMELETETGLKSAIFNFNLAILEEKYIHFYKSHENLGAYYGVLGQAYSNSGKHKASKKAFQKALDSYIKYNSNPEEEIALTEVQLELACTYLDQSSEVIQYGEAAIQYYEKQEEIKNMAAMASAYLWLGAAYLKEGKSESAIACIEKGIPQYNDCVNWAVEGVYAERLLAVMYQMAQIACEREGQIDKEAQYRQQYEDFVWLHDVEESDLTLLKEQFHWDVEI